MARRGSLAGIAPGAAAARRHGDRDSPARPCWCARAAIVISPSRPTVRASSIAAMISSWCGRLNQLEPEGSERSWRATRRLHLTRRAIDRLLRRKHDQEGVDHRRTASDDHLRRRPAARRHVGTGRQHDLRDRRTGNRPAARLGFRRRAHRAHHVGSRARGSRSSLSRVPAGRRGGAVHHHAR